MLIVWLCCRSVFCCDGCGRHGPGCVNVVVVHTAGIFVDGCHADGSWQGMCRDVCVGSLLETFVVALEPYQKAFLV